PSCSWRRGPVAVGHHRAPADPTGMGDGSEYAGAAAEGAGLAVGLRLEGLGLGVGGGRAVDAAAGRRGDERTPSSPGEARCIQAEALSRARAEWYQGDGDDRPRARDGGEGVLDCSGRAHDQGVESAS
ncbi:MAG: hypothetical protein AABZ01_07365, partial [Gemmatimonadota bacterium]